MRAEIISVDFSDLEHGLGALFEAQSAESRTHIAKLMSKDLENLPRCTALDEFITRLNPILAFGDMPSPSLRESFTQLVIAYSGWSADRLIAKKQTEQARAHGKTGGRGKRIGTVSFSSRDAAIIREFNAVRPHSSGNTDAAKRMIANGFEDVNGKVLGVSQICRIVRENKKQQKNNT
jgi:hypothetical protein